MPRELPTDCPPDGGGPCFLTGGTPVGSKDTGDRRTASWLRARPGTLAGPAEVNRARPVSPDHGMGGAVRAFVFGN
jgi:hypothetical protein